MTSNINMSRNFVNPGSEAILDGNPATGPSAISNALTDIYITRGSIDLSEGRLPTVDDVSVRPLHPIIEYDAFLVSVAGAVPSSVGGVSPLAIGDLLILTANTPTVASAWIGVKNTAIPNFNTNPLYGAANGYIRVVDKRSPFYP